MILRAAAHDKGNDNGGYAETASHLTRVAPRTSARESLSRASRHPEERRRYRCHSPRVAPLNQASGGRWGIAHVVWCRSWVGRSTWLMVRDRFETFVQAVRPRLTRALVATYGLDRGQEALAEALAYAWEHFEELTEMENPGGYLYRVGSSRTRRRRAHGTGFPAPEALGLPSVEPKLAVALAALTDRQRVCVALVHGYGWTHQETAEFLGLSRSSVQNHVERGLERLRRTIGVYHDA